MRKLILGMLLISASALLWGCPAKPPTKAYKQATDAIADARRSLAWKCAKDELMAAQKMMEKAKKLMDKGKYEEAKIAFDATRKLAQKAKEEARLNKENCLKDKTPPPVRTAQGPPTVVAARETPINDTRSKLTPIYFGFNQYTLTDESKRTLNNHASMFNRNKTLKLEVSGHCDQRGSVEYNLALGERRALAVKKYLVALGVARSRIAIISYGHQKPADTSGSPNAHNKNRRAEFRVSR